jgi:glutaredoxin 3
MAGIVMYATSWCPYCARAEMVTRSGRHTVPQIFIGETHVGGCDDLVELEATGELDTLLKQVHQGN